MKEEIKEDFKKAYDPKKLLEELKARGLDIAEDAANVVLEAVVAWLNKGAAASNTPIDDALMLGLNAMVPSIKKQIDKIDGKKDV